MPNEKAVADMSVEQREALLSALSKRLNWSASIANHEGKPIWRTLHALSEKLHRDGFEIANGTCDASSAAVQEAIELLAEFEIGRPPDASTVH